jgi:hypothetical protein
MMGFGRRKMKPLENRILSKSVVKVEKDKQKA